MAGTVSDDAGRPNYLHNDLMAEYARIADIVAAFDQRLLTIKSWGVTFSLATLALGFQQNHHGLFLVAASGALGFWLIEGSTKSHQLRFYPRMGDIEAIAHELYGEQTAHGIASSPMIDWGWHTAAQRIWGVKPKRFQWIAQGRWGKNPPREAQAIDPQVPMRWEAINPDSWPFDRILLWPHVALPHAIAVVLGLMLFALGLVGMFGPI